MFPQSKVQKLKLLRKNKNVSNNILFTSGSDVEDSAIRKNTQDYLPIHQFPQISQRNKTERESVARISGQYCETEQSQIPTQQSPINQPLSTRSNNFRKKAISNHQATHLNQKSPRILFSSVKKGHSPRALINPLNHLVSNSPKLGQFNLFVTKEYVEPKQFMKKYDLNQEEWERFGCRFPSNYTREKLLGRGGFSLIWLGKHVTTGQVYAVKQLPKKSKHETHLKELTFCNAFFNKGGQQKHLHDGSQYLCRMMDFVIEQNDIFIFYEVCGVSLGSLLYDFQIINEQTYKLVPQSLSLLFKQNQNQMYQFLKKLALIIDLLSKQGWVHCDIKSENILIKQSGQDIDLKLIDYGSSFKFEEVFEKFSMATPEYMCPELLNFILKENRMQYDIGLLRFIEDYNDPWAIDIWSLGCILLEIIHGLPLWMSYNTEVMSPSGMKMTQHGLFAVRGRQFGKIIEKQIKVVTNLDGVILNYNFSGIKIDSHIMKMLKGMLQINPKKRLSPNQLLQLINMKSNEG